MKVAVSVPDRIFAAAERLARVRGIARSQLFSQALAEFVSRHAPEAVTAKLNGVYATAESRLDAPLLRAQLGRLDREAW